MSILSKSQTLLSLILNPHLVINRTKYLFIFSHMRSRSSVLSHILGSNSDVTGYTELQISYTRRTDLIKMKTILFEESRAKLNNQYLLDKILHNKCPISSQIIRIANPKAIFLLRSPKATIQSVLNMNSATGSKYYTTPEEVLEYYCSRLLNLENLAREMRGNYFFIESDELVKNTDEVLDKLTEWLQLSNSLSRHYSTFGKTGVMGSGDPLDNIRSGVLKETPELNNIKIPMKILQEAEAFYERCRETLLHLTLPDLTCCSTDIDRTVLESMKTKASGI
jgi:hypothetical protein